MDNDLHIGNDAIKSIDENETVRNAFLNPRNHLTVDEREIYNKEMIKVVSSINPLDNKIYCCDSPLWSTQNSTNAKQKSSK